MKTQFASIWVIKSDFRFAVGTEIPVTLKSGKTKNVETAAYLYESGGFHYYLPKPKSED